MRKLLLLALVTLLQGCAFTDAHLDIAARPDANLKGPLLHVAPTSFDLQPLTDARSDTHRIGWKKNGYGSNTANILSNRPVTEVVVEAVSAGLRQNGHMVSAPADITVSGSLTRFWFDFKPNFFTVEFTGNVECELQFVSAKSGKTIYQSRYSGTYTKTTGGGLEGTWTEVMDSALEKMVEDVVFDQELIEALQAPR